MPLPSKQLDLLRRAAEREDRFVSRPDGLSERAAKALSAKLIVAGCVEPVAVSDEQPVWSQTPDDRTGLRITVAGLGQIGLIEDEPATTRVPHPSETDDANGPASRPQRITKQSRVVALLQRPDGANLNEIMDATGWLPHSTRAALTGLRKKGHCLVGTGRPTGRPAIGSLSTQRQPRSSPTW